MSDRDPGEALAENMSKSSDDVSVALASTAPAGKELLQEQKLSGIYRKRQLWYNLRIFVLPLQEADKTMIAMAKKSFSKAKKMDNSITFSPWALNSKSFKIKDACSIPE